jgi:hypothetical protein
MLLPMFGFIIALLVIGALANLLTIGDPNNSRLAFYVRFIFLFSGVGALCLSICFTLLFTILGYEQWSGVGFFSGYFIGLLGGAFLGFQRTVRRLQSVL